MTSISHLARRWFGSLSRRSPPADDLRWVATVLGPSQLHVWSRFGAADQRHAISVARRFEALGQWGTDELAAALLHDIGKLESGLGTTMRMVATVVGPRTARFRAYHDHESLGAALLTAGGSSPTTVALVGGTATGRAADALREADDI